MSRVQQKTRSEGATPARDNNRTLAIVGVLGALVVVVGLLVAIGLGAGRSDISTGAITGGAEGAEGTQGRIIGSEEATLVIKDFSDFRCPHCREAAASLTPRIIAEYINTGKAKLEFIPVAVLGEESVFSGQAALCAEDQGKFWEYHDKLFERQGLDEFNVNNLSRFAGEVGLNQQDFRDCLLSGKYREQIGLNNQEFQQAGATGTPTFIVGDQLISGAQSFEAVQPIIEEQLAK